MQIISIFAQQFAIPGLEKIKVIIADDMLFTRETLTAVLEVDEFSVIGKAEDGLQLMQMLESVAVMPDIILLDLEMPRMDGNVALAKIKAKYPDLKVIMFTTFSDGSLQNDFKEKGANSFLTKNTDPKIIIETIKNVHYLKGYNNLKKKSESIFTEGEIKVIPLILAGKKDKEICNILCLAKKTVEQYRSNLYNKTDTTNASEFSNCCTKAGLEFLGHKMTEGTKVELTKQKPGRKSKFSDTFRRMVVEEILSGDIFIEEAVKKHKLPGRSTVISWQKWYQKNKIEA